MNLRSWLLGCCVVALVGCGAEASAPAASADATGTAVDASGRTGADSADDDASGDASTSDVGSPADASAGDTAAGNDAPFSDVAGVDTAAAGPADAADTPDAAGAGLSDAAGLGDATGADSGAATDTAGSADTASDVAPSDTGATDGGLSDATAGGGGVPASQAASGLQYNGGVAFLRPLPGGQSEFVEISAPLLPSTKVLYSYEDTKFPATQAGMESVAVKAALVYDDLLVECAKDYPSITLLPPGSTKTLTPAQLQTNFNRTAECSYKKYTAKPYWIPKLVDQVDICGLKLGPDWRLLNEADLLALQPSELTLIAKTLTAPSGSWWGAFYFSLNVYVRQTKGSLALTTVANPPTFTTVEKAGASWYTDAQKWVIHLEGSWVVRCRRARKVIAGQ